jgi:hypothetical protein
MTRLKAIEALVTIGLSAHKNINTSTQTGLNAGGISAIPYQGNHEPSGRPADSQSRPSSADQDHRELPRDHQPVHHAAAANVVEANASVVFDRTHCHSEAVGYQSICRRNERQRKHHEGRNEADCLDTRVCASHESPNSDLHGLFFAVGKMIKQYHKHIENFEQNRYRVTGEWTPHILLEACSPRRCDDSRREWHRRHRAHLEKEENDFSNRTKGDNNEQQQTCEFNVGVRRLEHHVLDATVLAEQEVNVALANARVKVGAVHATLSMKIIQNQYED